MLTKRHLLSLAATAGMAIGTGAAVAPTRALADVTGDPSTNCASDPQKVNLLTSPIYIEVSAKATGGSNFVAVCYSDTAPGTPSNIAGGEAAVFVPTAQPYGETWCPSDPSAALGTACSVGVWPQYTTPATGGPQGTITVEVPFGYCVGSNEIVGYHCGNGTALAQTGVVVGTLSASPGAQGFADGAVITVSNVSVWVDGTQVPLSSGTSATVGVNPSAVGAAPGGPGIPFCAPVAGCGVLPAGAWVATSSSVTAADIVVGTTSFPLTLPTECLSVGTSCPS